MLTHEENRSTLRISILWHATLLCKDNRCLKQHVRDMVLMLLENPLQIADGIMFKNLIGVIGVSIVLVFCIFAMNNRESGNGESINR